MVSVSSCATRVEMGFPSGVFIYPDFHVSIFKADTMSLRTCVVKHILPVQRKKCLESHRKIHLFLL